MRLRAYMYISIYIYTILQIIYAKLIQKTSEVATVRRFPMEPFFETLLVPIGAC